MLVGIRGGCTAAVFAFSPTLFAETDATASSEQEACETICWSAPPECPSEADVRARLVEQQTAPDSESATLPALGLSARVARVNATFELVLTRLGQTRVIRSTNCETLADATAVVVALSQRDNANWPELMVTNLPQEVSPANEAQAAAGPPVTDEASAAVAIEAPTQPASTKTEASEQPEQEAPLPKPRTAREPETPPALRDDGQSSPSSPLFSQLRLGIGGLVDPWLLPELSLGLRLSGVARLRPWLELHLMGSWVPGVTTAIDRTPIDVDYDYLAAGAQLCAGAPELQWLAICAAFEVGLLSAFAPGLDEAERRQVVNPTPGLGAHYAPDVGSVYLDLGLEAWFPLRNDVFTVNAEGQALHKIPTVTARLALLVGYKF